MTDAGFALYEQLGSYRRLGEMVDNGDAEGLHLECKAPHEPKLTRDQKAGLGRAVSGFANTAGGVVIWGMSTTKHAHSGLDILTQIEPIGAIRQFQQIVQRAIPSLTTPPVLDAKNKLLLKTSRDSRGVLITYIPLTASDPVQTIDDNTFYFRSGDEFRPAPYELIKRLFAASDMPDLRPIFAADLVKREPNGMWRIPIVVQNLSFAVAEHALISVTIDNPTACASVQATEFNDVSAINPGKTVFMARFTEVVHHGMKEMVGDLLVKMKTGQRPRRRLDITISVFANRMHERELRYVLKLAKSGFTVTTVSDVQG